MTAAGGALAARWILGWSWTTSILFGIRGMVTGPTVITPLLRRIDASRPAVRGGRSALWVDEKLGFQKGGRLSLLVAREGRSRALTAPEPQAG